MIHDDDCRDCSGFEKTGFVVLRLKNRKRAKNKSRNESGKRGYFHVLEDAAFLLSREIQTYDSACR